METLPSKFLKLKQDSNSITSNPLLRHFNQDALDHIEKESINDKYIMSKRNKMLDLIRNMGVDFDPKLKSAFDEYSEALVYLDLRRKFGSITPIPEEKGKKTPDFKVDHQIDSVSNILVFAELKSLSFASGNLNYKDSMNQSLDAQINIEEQHKAGNKIGFGISEVAPLRNLNKDYDPYSTKYCVESIIEKIDHNIKAGQYESGETVLLINTEQIIFQSNHIEGALPFYRGGQVDSLISGVQWSVAFGKLGNLIFRPIEFEGSKNVDGQLNFNGILESYDFIKAICFIHQLDHKECKVLGLYRYHDQSDNLLNFLNIYCDVINDDLNSHAWEIEQLL